MSSPEYSAETVINQYEADISSWENQLHSFEEAVKGLSPDDPLDQQELAASAHEHLPVITDLYDEVQQTQEDVETLERQIDAVLENPDYRYAHIPESLNRQEKMKETISDCMKPSTSPRNDRIISPMSLRRPLISPSMTTCIPHRSTSTWHRSGAVITDRG